MNENEKPMKKTFTFRWIEHHSHEVEADSLDEAKQIFEYEQSEGFGGKSTYSDSEEPYTYIDEIP